MSQRKVVIAGRYADVLRWLRENPDVNPRHVIALVGPGDENKVRGLRLTDDEVAYASGWSSLPADRLFAFEQQIKWCQI